MEELAIVTEHLGGMKHGLSDESRCVPLGKSGRLMLAQEEGAGGSIHGADS